MSSNSLLNKESGIALGDALKTNTTLKYLCLKKNDLKTDGSKYLRISCDLVSNSFVNSRIIEALGINTTLTELELGLLTDESLAYLAEFLGKNSSVKNIGFEEGKNELQIESKIEE